MIDASAYSQPVSRNDFFDNGATSVELEKENLRLVFSDNSEIKPVQKILILNDEATGIVANIIYKNKKSSAEIIGKVTYSKLYYEEDILFIQIITPIPESALLQLLEIIVKFEPLLVCAVTLSSQIIENCYEGDLRSLVTTDLYSCIKSKIIPENLLYLKDFKILNCISKIEYLNVGIVITGLIAAMMSYFELRSIPAISIICSRKAAISVNVLKSYEKVLPILSGILNISLVNKATTEQYKLLVSRDPFANTTENIYT